MELITAVKRESEKYGLHLNLKKTKVMSDAVLGEFELDGETIEDVDSFVVVGTGINRDATSEKEIRRRTTLGRRATPNWVKIWICREVIPETNKSLVFPGNLYGCGAWTIEMVD